MKKSLALLPVVVSSLVTSPAVCSDEITIRLSEESVSAYLNPTLSETNSSHLGLLYNDDEDGILLTGGLFANGQREMFSGRLGGKLYYADTDGKSGSDSGYGVALGGDFSYMLMPDLALNGGIFYAPTVLAFSDFDQYKEWFVRVNYKVFETARVGMGYGSLELEPEDNGRDIEMEDGFFIEMNLQFQ